MDVIESVGKVFDKMPITETGDKWEVKEADNGASFKKLAIDNKGSKFHTIENAAYKGWGSMLKHNSWFIEDADCDGAAFTRVNERTYLILAELKSTLSTDALEKAFRQIVFTYLKLHMLLAVCEGGEPGKYEVAGVIACHPPKNSAQEDFLRMQYLNIEETSADKKCMVKLYIEKKLEAKFGKLFFMKDKPLLGALKNKKFTLYLKTSATALDTEACMELDELVTET